MTTERPNTPGVLGLIAWLGVGYLVLAVLLGALVAALALADGDPAALWLAVVYPIVAIPYAAILGAPVAAAGVLVVQVCCWWVASQAVHVLLAGVVGTALTAAYLPLIGFPGGVVGGVLPIFVGVAAASGRAAAIPLVRLGARPPIGPRAPAPVTLSRRALPMRADER